MANKNRTSQSRDVSDLEALYLKNNRSSRQILRIFRLFVPLAFSVSVSVELRTVREVADK